jgi:site-specific recombinase XerD
MKSSKLMICVQAFFQEYLIEQRGLSQNTVLAYRDTLKLFFAFESARQRKPVAHLRLDDLNVNSVLLFLNQIESVRKNSILTRNSRLAALRTLSRFLTIKDLLRAGEYQRIIALPLKKAPRKVIDYLEIGEINAIKNAVDLGLRGGQRDYALLNLLYNTGARVQEICDLTVGAITFGSLPVVTLVGKGRKARQVPIWPETAEILISHLRNHELLDTPSANLFVNANGQPLGRFGIRYIIQKWSQKAASKWPSLRKKTIGPHTYRHSLAMHLLQAGVDLSIIKSWLGHVNLATTHAYVEIDMNMKRDVLDAYSPVGGSKSIAGLLSRNKDILSWLESI